MSTEEPTAATQDERTTVNKTTAKEMYCLSEKDVRQFPAQRCHLVVF